MKHHLQPVTMTNTLKQHDVAANTATGILDEVMLLAIYTPSCSGMHVPELTFTALGLQALCLRLSISTPLHPTLKISLHL